MPKTYTFNQLPEKIQTQVAKEYLKGWLVTHPQERKTASLSWAKEMCQDDGMLYDQKGNIIDPSK